MKNLSKLIHECIHTSINNILSENVDTNSIDSIMSKHIQDAQFALRALQELKVMFNEAYNKVSNVFSNLMESYGYYITNVDIEDDFNEIVIKFYTNITIDELESDNNYDDLYYPIMSSIQRLKQDVESSIGSDFCNLKDDYDFNNKLFLLELTLTINEERIYPNRN